jgi:hypothetical protein
LIFIFFQPFTIVPNICPNLWDLLLQLKRIEEILIGITNAGVNDIESVEYQNGELKELRAEARRQAVQAARKAEKH